jgi:YVTN family beta-propeller protein
MRTLKLLMLLIATTVFTVSCESDDDGMNTDNSNGSISISANATTVSENAGDVLFTVTTTDPVLVDTTYEVALMGTALETEDYTLNSTMFTISEGETTAVITISIIDDTTVEEAETIEISVISENNEPLANPISETVTITDNDNFAFEAGLLISNEGPFGSGFGTVSYIDANFTTVDNDIYQDVNNDNLGNIVQSIGFSETNAYVVENVGNKITVVNRFSFEEIAKIETGLMNPRFMVTANNKGYVTNWGSGSDATDDYIAVIDLSTNTITTTIPVSEGPEELLFDGTNIYVAHQGGFGVNNEISIINPATDAVTSTITVGKAPNSLQLDASGNLWVMSSGQFSYQGDEEGGSISVINTTSNTVSTTYSFPQTEHPSYLNIDNGSVYYGLNGGVYKGDTANFILPTEPEISSLNLYGLVVNDNVLYACDPNDFSSNGSVHIYNLTDNSLTTSFTVGVLPNNVYFNN